MGTRACSDILIDIVVYSYQCRLDHRALGPELESLTRDEIDN